MVDCNKVSVDELINCIRNKLLKEIQDNLRLKNIEKKLKKFMKKLHK